MDELTILENSICNNCSHYVIRTIVPLFPEDWSSVTVETKDEINDEETDTDNLTDSFDEDNDEEIMEHRFCKELGIDLDHGVIECSEYIHKEEQELLIRHPKVFNM